jgi:predicted dehydrogenase
MMDIITVAIAGLGSRGRDAYASYIGQLPENVKITAVADLLEERLSEAAATFGIPIENCFKSAKEMLNADKLADILLVCTPDENHYETASMAIKKGYHLLLEKPVATTDAECSDIARIAKEQKRHVVVCHVLRYAPFYEMIKKVVASGKIGKVVTINAFEGVGYYHQAHSYVRGKWRDSDASSPMILAKCCHDIDILIWLMDAHVESVSSYGGLFYLKPENAPEGSTERCMSGCKAKENCPYDAEKIYITGSLSGIQHGHTTWPSDVLAKPVTEENIRRAIEVGPYGRCVFKCDNNVVDHQVVNLEFEGGKTAHLTMSGFTPEIYRTITVTGTLGMIEGDMRTNIIKTTVFGQPAIAEDLSLITGGQAGHGGGDARMLDALFGLLSGKKGDSSLTSIEASVESHLVCFAAERSRLAGGAPEVFEAVK